MRPRNALLLMLLAGVAVTATALAASPVLHEYVAPDPKEDVTLGTFTVAGQLAASLETPSGMVSAPDTLRAPTSSDKAYGSSRASQDAVFYPDADTRRPDRVQYEEPFSPSVMPFKRLNVFDTVSADFGLRVAAPQPRKITPGGVAGPNDEAFYGDITVDVSPGESVRIPSVSAGARILKLHTVPDTSVEIFKDGAENWFVKSPSRARVRVLLQLAAPRGAFGGPVADAQWRSIPPAPTLPPNVKAAAVEVNRVIGINHQEKSFRDTVGILVAYYRGFAESAEPLTGKGDLYTQIALSKQGVCRHRAFAFVVSALAVGIPARLVTNEAHAWVEVDDGRGFHRIDLGGAAVDVDDQTADARVPHKPPADPFSWPNGATSSASAAADRARRARTPDAADRPAGSATAAAPPKGSGASADILAPTPSAAPDDPADARPKPTLALTVAEQRVSRNESLHVKGTIVAGGDPCGSLRVDIVLAQKGTRDLALGALATDEKGVFDGAVVVPTSLTLGEYEVLATTPGDAHCGAGKSAATP